MGTKTKKVLDDFLKKLPPSTLKALEASDDRVEYLAKKFNLSSKVIKDTINVYIETTPKGSIPDGADKEKVEKLHQEIEDGFFNEKDDKDDDGK